MSGQHFTQSLYTLQQTVRLFGDLIYQLVEAGSTRSY